MMHLMMLLYAAILALGVWAAAASADTNEKIDQNKEQIPIEKKAA